MRTIMKATIPVEDGNKAIKDGSLPKIIQQTVEMTKPEATYFYAQDGVRTAFFIFDMKDSSQMPSIAEPLYMSLNATVEFNPVMNLEDLQKGLSSIKR